MDPPGDVVEIICFGDGDNEYRVRTVPPSKRRAKEQARSRSQSPKISSASSVTSAASLRHKIGWLPKPAAKKPGPPAAHLTRRTEARDRRVSAAKAPAVVRPGQSIRELERRVRQKKRESDPHFDFSPEKILESIPTKLNNTLIAKSSKKQKLASSCPDRKQAARPRQYGRYDNLQKAEAPKPKAPPPSSVEEAGTKKKPVVTDPLKRGKFKDDNEEDSLAESPTRKFASMPSSVDQDDSAPDATENFATIHSTNSMNQGNEHENKKALASKNDGCPYEVVNDSNDSDDGFEKASKEATKKRKPETPFSAHNVTDKDGQHPKKKKRESPSTDSKAPSTSEESNRSRTSANSTEYMDRKMPGRSDELRETAPSHAKFKDAPPLSVNHHPGTIAGSTAAALEATGTAGATLEFQEDNAPIFPGAQGGAQKRKAHSRNGMGGSFSDTHSEQEVSIKEREGDAQSHHSRNNDIQVGEEALVGRSGYNDDPIINMEVFNGRNAHVEDDVDDDLMPRMGNANDSELDTDRARRIVRKLLQTIRQNETVIAEIKSQQMTLVSIITVLLVVSGCLLVGLVGCLGFR